MRNAGEDRYGVTATVGVKEPIRSTPGSVGLRDISDVSSCLDVFCRIALRMFVLLEAISSEQFSKNTEARRGTIFLSYRD